MYLITGTLSVYGNAHLVFLYNTVNATWNINFLSAIPEIYKSPEALCRTIILYVGSCIMRNEYKLWQTSFLLSLCFVNWQCYVSWCGKVVLYKNSLSPRILHVRYTWGGSSEVNGILAEARTDKHSFRFLWSASFRCFRWALKCQIVWLLGSMQVTLKCW